MRLRRHSEGRNSSAVAPARFIGPPPAWALEAPGDTLTPVKYPSPENCASAESSQTLAVRRARPPAAERWDSPVRPTRCGLRAIEGARRQFEVGASGLAGR